MYTACSRARATHRPQGDASAADSSNRIEGILLWLVRYLVQQEWGLTGEPSTWFSKLREQLWVTPKIDEWMRERAAIFGLPTNDQTKAENSAALWQLVPGTAQGYFDDGQQDPIPSTVHTQQPQRRAQQATRAWTHTRAQPQRASSNARSQPSPGIFLGLIPVVGE